MITKPKNRLRKSLAAILPIPRNETSGERLWNIMEATLVDPLAGPIYGVERVKQSIDKRLPQSVYYSFHPGLPTKSFSIWFTLGYPDREFSVEAPLHPDEELLHLNTFFKELGPNDWETLGFAVEKLARLFDHVAPRWAVVDLFDRFPFGKSESVLSDVHWVRYYPRMYEAEVRRLESLGAVVIGTKSGCLVRFWKDPFNPPDDAEVARLRDHVRNTG